MSSSSGSSDSQPVKVPDDPDPTPQLQADPAPVAKDAARTERKRVAKSYGRQQTILAGDSSVDNENKKTILGG